MKILQRKKEDECLLPHGIPNYSGAQVGNMMGWGVALSITEYTK